MTGRTRIGPRMSELGSGGGGGGGGGRGGRGGSPATNSASGNSPRAGIERVTGSAAEAAAIRAIQDRQRVARGGVVQEMRGQNRRR